MNPGTAGYAWHLGNINGISRREILWYLSRLDHLLHKLLTIDDGLDAKWRLRKRNDCFLVYFWLQITCDHVKIYILLSKQLGVTMFTYYKLATPNATIYFRVGHNPITSAFEFYQSLDNKSWTQYQLTDHKKDELGVIYLVEAAHKEDKIELLVPFDGENIYLDFSKKSHTAHLFQAVEREFLTLTPIAINTLPLPLRVHNLELITKNVYPPLINKAVYPTRYTELYAAAGEDLVQGARNILIDYTKDESCLPSGMMRIFCFHWRNNVDAARKIIRQIDSGAIVNPIDLLNVLNAVQPQNQQGSFARRKAFILEKMAELIKASEKTTTLSNH